MSAPAQINEKTLENIFTTGLKQILKAKYEAILEEAKKKLEQEYRETVESGAERVSTEIQRMFCTSDAMTRLDVVIRVLEVKK